MSPEETEKMEALAKTLEPLSSGVENKVVSLMASGKMKEACALAGLLDRIDGFGRMSEFVPFQSAYDAGYFCLGPEEND